MNIFVLSKDPKWAARYHGDKHLIKMITETCQLLSNGINTHVGKTTFSQSYKDQVYNRTHLNHPCTLWVQQHQRNFVWLTQFLGYLIKEYDFRFGNKDKFIKARRLHELFQQIILDNSFDSSEPFLFIAVVGEDEDLQIDDTVLAYRMYYKRHKQHLHKYTKRKTPKWLRK